MPALLVRWVRHPDCHTPHILYASSPERANPVEPSCSAFIRLAIPFALVTIVHNRNVMGPVRGQACQVEQAVREGAGTLA
jgi:hypothetical protein